MSAMPFALQLYSVRDMLAESVPATLEAVKKAGYDHVELIEPDEMKPADFKSLLDSAGLAPMSLHVGIDALEADPLYAVEKAKTYGIEYVVMPWVPDERLVSADGWQKCGDSLAFHSTAFKDNGIQLCFHNHDQEFRSVNGTRILDLIVSDKVHLELDAYWATYAGFDPVKIIGEFSGRIPLLHTKEMLDAESKKFAPVGSGILDWSAIFDAAKKAGVLWYVVEQDECYGDVLGAIKQSASFLKSQTC